MSNRIQRRMMVMSCVAILFVGGHLGHSADKKTKTVKVTIDYGDGFQKRYTQIRWKPKMTVLDVTQAAVRHKRGIKIRYRGKGATAFLTQIDDLKNEGRGRNWLYQVNGKLADRSFAIYSVKSGDAILWKFGKYK